MSSPSDNLEVNLLLQRMSARIGDLESFLSLLIVRHGYPTDAGFRYDLTNKSAFLLREQLSSSGPSVVITYESALDMHVIDAVST